MNKDEILDLVVALIYAIMLFTIDNITVLMIFALVYAAYLGFREYTYYKANGKIKSKLDMYIIVILVLCSIFYIIKNLAK